MAKVHYIIDSKKKAHIKKNIQGKISVVIEDVVKIEENHTTKLDYGKFINGSETKHKKRTLDEWITLILYFMAVILLVLLASLLAIAKDLNILNSNYIDNIIGIMALLFGLSSVPKVKEFLGRMLVGPTIIRKLWYIVMMLCLPFYIIVFMDWVGLSSGISNICGIIGIIICILTW